MSAALKSYDQNFELILNHIKVRGFKDFGLEGKMRQYNHLLEDRQMIPMVDLLMLRRHEKDFFIRKETSYVDKFNALWLKIRKGFLNREGTDKYTVKIFKHYHALFNEIVRQDLEMGLFNNTGLKSKINAESDRFENLTEQLRSISLIYTERKIQQGYLFFGATVSISIILSLIMGAFVARQLANPLTRLAKEMYGFNVNIEYVPEIGSKKGDSEEIQILQESFAHMAVTMQRQFTEIKEKSDLLETKNKSLNKLNKELDKFIYSASHDLKAPLSSMLGLIYLMKKEVKSPEEQEYLFRMEKTINKLELHIKEIINYAKNHQLDISWQEVDIKEMIENTVDMLKYQQGAEDISVLIDINQHELFVSDNMRLNMVLFNLISNAFKYHDDSKANKIIQISAEINLASSQITIEDNGIGIEQEHIDKIFNLFYRASEKSTGSGLGLFIVKEAVDKLGGEIHVRSEVGQGTKFVILLPHIGQTSFLGLTTYKAKDKKRKKRKLAA
jgi:signal transduction histidine kinase